MPEYRKDPITGSWVIIAIERAKRPSDYDIAREVAPRATPSPFEAGNEAATPPEIQRLRAPEAPAHHPWSVRVIPNKYPALQIEGPLRSEGRGLYDAMSGLGAHEVIVESPEDVLALETLPRWQIATVLRAWRARLRDLRHDPRLKCALIFKNHGAAAGASVAHTHSQLIALPMIPDQLARELDGAQAYHDFRGRCVFCDILAQAQAQPERLVYQNRHVVVLAPFASRHPFELWLLPRRHAAGLERCEDEELEPLADALKVALDKLGRALEGPPYNMVLHSAPFELEGAVHYHWHIELLPKLGKQAGFEIASGFHINPTSPEEAARHLREIDA